MRDLFHDHNAEADFQPRILIVSENASTRFGGEAILPWHYFRILRRRGIDARLISHDRTRDELLALLPGESDRMYFMPDTGLNKLACRVTRFLPAQIADITVGYCSRLDTQWDARRLARRLVAEHDIDGGHQPTPVSPRESSLMYGIGAPVIIGPMNGNMTYPPAFMKQGTWKISSSVVARARTSSDFVNRMMPGKLRAAALVVANERTRLALPKGARGEVFTLVENGVDLGVWSQSSRPTRPEGPTRFVFMGRLVDWKAVDLLLEALARIEIQPLPHLEVLGDGGIRAALQAQASQLGLGDRVHFAGWQTQKECARRLRESDVLVLPSLYECGGAVVLEAMACGLPVVATAWGGPLDYLDDTCGFLIPPDSREALVSGLSDAMSRLALDPALRESMGRAGRERVEREFDWEVKVDHMLSIYRRVCVPPMSLAGRENHPGPDNPTDSSLKCNA